VLAPWVNLSEAWPRTHGGSYYVAMRYRRKKNRPDSWLEYCDRNRAVIASIGLPEALFKTELALSEFLSAGRLAGVAAELDALPEPEFSKLFHFVTMYFDYDAVNFTAMETRRLKTRATRAVGG